MTGSFGRILLFSSLAAAAGVILAGLGQAKADTIFVGTPNLTSTVTTVYQAGFGFYETTGTAQVNELGFWVSPMDSGGMGKTAVDHTVTLYQANGSDYSVIAQQTVPAGSVAQDAYGYAWVSTPLITLSNTANPSNPNPEYIVAATEGTDVWGPNTGGTNSFSFVDSYFGVPNPFGFYNTSVPALTINDFFIATSVNAQYAGANIGLVPEPTSLVLIGLGAVELLLVGAKRRCLRLRLKQ